MHSSGGCFHQTMNLLPRYPEKKASQNRHFVTGVVQFIRKVSDSELTKRAILINIRTALNVILSNCTKSRNFSRRLYGDSIFSWKFKSVNYDVLQYRKRTAFKSFFILGMLRRPSMGRPQKKYEKLDIRTEGHSTFQAVS